MCLLAAARGVLDRRRCAGSNSAAAPVNAPRQPNTPLRHQQTRPPVVPLVRPAVYAEHLLGALDRALAAEEEEPPFASEVLLSPVDASAQPTYALPNHSRFELRLLHDEPRPRRAFVTSGEHSCGAPPRFEAVFDALGGAAARGAGRRRHHQPGGAPRAACCSRRCRAATRLPRSFARGAGGAGVASPARGLDEQAGCTAPASHSASCLPTAAASSPAAAGARRTT